MDGGDPGGLGLLSLEFMPTPRRDSRCEEPLSWALGMLPPCWALPLLACRSHLTRKAATQTSAPDVCHSPPCPGARTHSLEPQPPGFS